jgi:2-hydroxychromene-2-carboxylate isomerase
VWLASVRLPALLRGLQVDLDLVPVWEPEPELRARLAAHDMVWDFPQPSRAKRFYILQDVRRHARAYGLSIVWPIDRAVRWSPPHVGFLYAQARGCGPAYHARVLAARFTQGKDVTDPAVLAAIAREVGLDPADLLATIAEDRLADRILECFRMAGAHDVFGWPFFVYGRQKFWGNDRLEWLVEAIRADRAREGARGGAS